MRGNCKNGFTLFEILIALALIALLGTVIVPNLTTRVPAAERKAFVANLNALVGFAWQQALITNKLHKVSVDLGKKLISVSVRSDAPADSKQKDEPFEPIKQANIKTSLVWPDNLVVKNFYIEGFDEAARYGSGRKMEETWFFIVPEGLAQDVVINITDTKDRSRGRPKQIGLVLNPFTAQFKEYGTFQQP